MEKPDTEMTDPLTVIVAMVIPQPVVALVAEAAAIPMVVAMEVMKGMAMTMTPQISSNPVLEVST